MTTALTVECPLPLTRQGRGGRTVRRVLPTDQPSPPVTPTSGRIPRVARLMALAIHFDDLLRRGLARDQADLARLGQVTQARMSQIMSLLNLAPDIQEAILFLPAVVQGRPDLILANLLPIAREWEWGRQRMMWKRLIKP